jgi:hypothetical protein
MEKELIIKVRRDNSQANQAAKEWAQAAKKAEAEVLAEARAAEKARAELAREASRAKQQADREASRARAEAERTAAQVMKDLIREGERTAKQSAAEQARAAKEAAQTVAAFQKKAAQESAAAQAVAAKKAREEAAETARGISANVGAIIAIAQEGFRLITGFLQGVGDAINKARDKSKQLTEGFAENRDQLGELAVLMGRQADNQFTLDIARYGKQTGLTQGESREFLTGLYNSGAQYEGKTISSEELSQYRVQAAKLSVARGLPQPGVVGDVAGGVLGFEDYSKYGGKASEVATGKLNSALAILGRGKGDNAVLARQFAMLSAASLNEDELKGTFQSSDEVATAISVAAEKHDAQAAEMVRAGIRGMRDFKGKPGDLLRRAGVTPKTGTLESFGKIAPIIEAEAKRAGVNVEDQLREYFEDQLTREAVSVFINKGISGGAIADRRAFGAQNAGPQAAEQTITGAEGLERVQRRKADAGVKFAEQERGAVNSRLEIIRKQALDELIRERQIDTTATNVTDYVYGKATFGVLGQAEQRRIDTRSRDILNRRTPAAIRPKGGPQMRFTQESVEQAFNRQLDAIQNAGINPFQELSPDNQVRAVPPGVEAMPPGANPAAPKVQAAPIQIDQRPVIGVLEQIRDRLPNQAAAGPVIQTRPAVKTR